MSPRLNLTNYSTHDKTHHPFLCWNMTDEGWFGLKREASIPEKAESKIRFEVVDWGYFPCRSIMSKLVGVGLALIIPS